MSKKGGKRVSVKGHTRGWPPPRKPKKKAKK